MNQTVYTVFQHYKCAEWYNAYHFTGYNGVHCIFFSSCIPWIWNQLFQTQRNLFFFFIYFQNVYFDFLTFFYHIGRIFYTTPAHFGYMQQAVYAAQIYKSTKRSQPAYNTFSCLSFFNGVPNLFFACFFFFFQNFTTGKYDFSGFWFKFNNFEL